MILAVTGGRQLKPTDEELGALWLACLRRSVRVVRFGDCPTGVDAAVQAACEDMRPGLDVGQRRWAWEQWQADWDGQGKSAGPRRNRAMLNGDPAACAGVFSSSASTSIGEASALVAWPGGDGTRNCVDEARRRGIRVVPIIELMRA